MQLVEDESILAHYVCLRKPTPISFSNAVCNALPTSSQMHLYGCLFQALESIVQEGVRKLYCRQVNSFLKLIEKPGFSHQQTILT